MTHPTDEELDALVEYLRDKGFISQREAAALTALRAQLAEAWAERDNANKIMDDWTTLHRVIADIRYASGLGSRPMLSDLAAEIGRLLAAANARADRADADITSLTASCAELATENEQLRAERDDYAYKLNAANDTYTEMHLEIERWRDRADRAEAALAAQIEADAGILQAVADNWDCGHNESRYCRCAELAEQWGIAADAIRAQPHDRTALDRMLRAEREKALRDAADAFMDGSAPRMTILAMIEQDGA